MKTFVLLVLLISSAHADPPKPPHGIRHVTLDFKHYSVVGQQTLHYDLAWDPAGQYTTQDKKTVTGDAIRALAESVTDTRPSDQDLTCSSGITDNGMAFTVTLDGDAPMVLTARSDCKDNAPWNVLVGKQRSVQVSGAIGRQVHAILETLDPTGGKPWMDGQSERAVVSFPPHSPEVVSCERDLAKATALFGAKVSIHHGMLSCDRDKVKDCSVFDFRAFVSWSGVEVSLEMGCRDGRVVTPQNVITPVRALVESKVMRAVMSVADERPRIEPDGARWKVGRTGKASATLVYDPAKKLVTIWSTAQAFWDALGVKPASNSTFTLDGKLVR